MAEQKARAACCAGPAPTVCLRMRPVRGPAPAVLLEAREEHPDGLGVEVCRGALHHALRCSLNRSFWPSFLREDALALAFLEAWTLPCPLVLLDCPLHLSVLS